MVFNNSILLGAGGQGGAVAPFDTTLIGNSIWLDGSGTSGDAATDTWGSESNQDRWIWATWYQPLREIDATGDRNTIFASGSSSNGFYLRHNSTSSTFNIFCRDNAGNEGAINTSESYRDLTAWYHVLVDFDSANAVANDRISLYVNGVRVGTYSGTDIGQNNHLNTNVSGQTARIGQDASTTPNYHVQGYLAQTVFLDNKSIANGDLAITDFLDTYTFGTNGSQRIPKSNTDIIALASAAGNNSFCLDYSDSSNIVNDASSKGNNFTPTGGGSPTITSANQSVHTPSKVYPIVNALTKVGSAASTLEEGNTKATVNDNGGIVITPTLPFSGLWYFEINVTTNAAWYPGIGQQSALGYNSTGAWNNTTAETHVWLSDHSGNYFNNNGSLSTYPIANPTTGRFAVAWDGDNRALYFGQISGSTITWTNSGDPTSGSSKTGAAPGNWPTTGTDPLYFIVIGGGTSVMEFDFDEDDWTGVTNRPADAKVLNSANLTAPDYQGIDYFDATLYEGNGTGQRVGDFVPFTDAYTVDNSAMFEHDDARYLSRTIETPSSPNGRKGTWSVWFKTANIDTDCVFFDTGTTATNRFSLQMDASGQIVFSHGGTTVLKTSGDFKGDGAWHNLVLKVDTELDPGETGATPNRAIMFIDGVQLTSTDFDTTPTNTNIPEDEEIGYMDPGATQFVGSYDGSSANQWDGYLAEVVFLDNQYLNASSFGQLDTSTNRWVPKNVSGLTFGDSGFYLEFETAPNLGTLIAQGTGTPIGNMTAGGGLAAAFDGDIENYNAGAQANATSGNIGKDWGSSVTKTITGVVVKMLGNVTIDGGAAAETMTLTVERSANGTDFTTVYTESGISVAAGAIVTRRDGFTNTAAARYARISVSHSGGAETHISELEFYEGGTSGIGTDSSGNGNNFTQGGSWAASDQFIDTPSKNFATIDPVISNGGTPVTVSEGNLTGVRSSSGFQQAYSDFSGFRLQENTGIYFAEVLVGSDTSNFHVGVLSGDPPSSTNRYLGQDSNTYGYDLDGRKVNNGTYTTYGASYTAGDVIGIEIDTDTGAINFHKNGSDQGQAFTAIPGPYNFAFASESGGGPGTFNFGQLMELGGASTTLNATAGGRFKHTPPTGAKALNQDNLDDTASKITAWAWIKNRDRAYPNAEDYVLVDRVRGIFKVIPSNETDAETTEPNTVQRFFQRGVQVGSETNVNRSGDSHVLWQWLLGDSATTGSTTSPAGSLASTSIVADAGHFAVISYTGNATSGATIGHGMSAAPEMLWVKERDNANGFIVSSTVIGFDKILRLDTTDDETSDSGAFNSTAPSATLITLGSNNGTNRSSGQMICYAFRSVPGVCKIGSYIGNGSTDGPYIATGFKPRWVIYRVIDSGINAYSWTVVDTARSPINGPLSQVLHPNADSADGTTSGNTIDILSDGWKRRDSHASVNQSGKEYIYMAMADIGGNGTLPPIYGR